MAWTFAAGDAEGEVPPVTLPVRGVDAVAAREIQTPAVGAEGEATRGRGRYRLWRGETDPAPAVELPLPATVRTWRPWAEHEPAPLVVLDRAAAVVEEEDPARPPATRADEVPRSEGAAAEEEEDDPARPPETRADEIAKSERAVAAAVAAKVGAAAVGGGRATTFCRKCRAMVLQIEIPGVGMESIGGF